MWLSSLTLKRLYYFILNLTIIDHYYAWWLNLRKQIKYDVLYLRNWLLNKNRIFRLKLMITWCNIKYFRSNQPVLKTYKITGLRIQISIAADGRFRLNFKLYFKPLKPENQLSCQSRQAQRWQGSFPSSHG